MKRFAGATWAAGAAGTFGGRRLGLRVTHGAMLEAMRPALPPILSPLPQDALVDALFSVVTHESPSLHHSLYAGAHLINRSGDLALLLHELERYIDMMLAFTVRDRVFLHAGVAGVGGRAILLPGVSGAGKSTLVRALVARGATYYSDDCAIVDDEGLVHAYPRGRGAPSPRDEPPPIPVDSIVFTHHSSAHDPHDAAPRVLEGGAVVLALLRHATSARSRPAQALAVLARVARGARAYEAPRGEAAPFAARILRSMREPEGPEGLGVLHGGDRDGREGGDIHARLET